MTTMTDAEPMLSGAEVPLEVARERIDPDAFDRLERAAPEQYQSELPLGARGPPVQSRLL